jgi:hypothetical protein
VARIECAPRPSSASQWLAREIHPGYEERKKAACNGKRPKSREETPKEGCGNAKRYRTAAIYIALHKPQADKGGSPPARAWRKTGRERGDQRIFV